MDHHMSAIPDIWGAGQLIAFSGMEGPTCATSPMVAHTLGDRIGLRIFFEPAVELWCQADRGEDPNRRYPRCQPTFEIVTGDAIRLRARFTDGHTCGMAFAPVGQDVMVGESTRQLPPRWSVGREAGRAMGAGMYVHHSDQGPSILVVEDREGQVRFALGHDATDEQAALGKARRGLECDLHALIDDRRRWCESITPPEHLPVHLERTYRKAVTIMRVNTCTPEGQIRHRWTTPDRWPHRWMWLHDTAYHTAGHVHHFRDLACDMLSAVFDTQEDDGRIALLMMPHGNFPGISQSPILTWAIRLAYQASNDRDWLAAIYPKVRSYVEYFRRSRAFGETGLFRWLHSDESMDNNPRFDETSDFGAIDLSCTLAREFADLAELADALGETGDAKRYREAYLAVAEAINARLWDERAGQYGDLMPNGRLVVLSTCATFLPLYAGVVAPERAERLRKLLLDENRFWRPLPVPTVAADEPTFYPDMWRGPSWINMNHLIGLGLDRAGFRQEADELRRRSIELIHRWYAHTGCIYEFYDCEDRIPPFAIDRKSRICYGGGFVDISDYHWTAALFVAMCRMMYG
jgi:hypothetical protein